MVIMLVIMIIGSYYFYTGLKNQNISLHPHTLFIINQKYWKTPERTANALMYMFAYAINEARKKFGVRIRPHFFFFFFFFFFYMFSDECYN